MSAKPAKFSAKGPATAGGWIIDKHQGRIVGIQQKDNCLTYPRDEIDKEGGNGHQNTKKGNFDSFKDVGKKSGNGKICLTVEMFSGIQFFGSCAEKGVTRS